MVPTTLTVGTRSEGGLAHTPMRPVDLDEPRPTRPDWVMARTRLTGICGSDAKQVFMDFGEDDAFDFR